MMAHDPSLFAAGAALNALDEMEAAQFGRHLEDCPTCRVESSGFAETAARLGAASAEPPPAALREAVLAAVAVTRQLPPLTDRADRADPIADGIDRADGAAPGAPDGRGAQIIDLAGRRRGPSRWLLSAAVAVAIALLGVTLFVLNRPAADDSALDLRQCVDTAADREQLPAAPGSAGQTTVTVSATCGGAVVSIQGVPQPQAGLTYQLWVISGDRARSVDTMTPDADGSMPETVADVHVGDTALGVTVEPAGGSPAPTSAPVITVPLSA